MILLQGMKCRNQRHFRKQGKARGTERTINVTWVPASWKSVIMYRKKHRKTIANCMSDDVCLPNQLSMNTRVCTEARTIQRGEEDGCKPTATAPHLKLDTMTFSTVLSPLILPSNLIFLLWSEIVCDVECPANLLRGLSLDHVGYSLAANIQKRFNVQIVGCLRCVNESESAEACGSPRKRNLPK
jgi:hypothetical protein